MSRNPNLISEKFRAMGTDISIDVVLDENISEERAKAGIEMVRDIFEKYEQIFSRFLADSELSKINKKTGEKLVVSSEMFEVLSLCLKYNRESLGYFDPRVIDNLEKIGYDKDFKTNDPNSAENCEVWLEKITGKLEEDLILNKDKKTVLIKKRIDTTGIAKGYIVDRVVEYLKGFSTPGGPVSGWKNFIVDAGGDMFAEGLNEKMEAWQVGVEGCEKNCFMLKLSGEGIATSGISRKRWQKGSKKVHHLINPKDPDNFSHTLKTVTVIKNKTVEADGKAKVLFLMGLPEGMKFADVNNLKALFLDYKGNIFLSKAIKKHIVR